MRKAKYSAKQVNLPSASGLGFGRRIAKPGSWVVWAEGRCGRVLGRIDESSRDGLENCDGWLAVMVLGQNMTHSFVMWIDPADVRECYDAPPAALLAWITGDDWPKRAADIPRLIAMSAHGTCSESYIAQRDWPEKPYNARPEYVRQFILE